MARRREKKGAPLLCMRSEIQPGEPECFRKAWVVVERVDGEAFSLCRACYAELRGALIKRLYPV
jgi:hypothetical protein